METVDKYFLNKVDQISFIELKEGAWVDVGDYTIEDDIPLPIVTDTLLKEARDGEVEEGFKASHLIEGIIYILGIDPEFKYNEQYKRILYSYDSKIEDYIMYTGFQHIQKGDYEQGAIYFRALTHINEKNVQGLFNYALCLENLSRNLIDQGKIQKADRFLLESTNQLEDLIGISEEFAPAYYKLGYYYRYFDQYLKTKLIWEKYLAMGDNEIYLQEVREQLESITDDINFEIGSDALNRGDYRLALENFLPLSDNRGASWNVYYLIGLAYRGLGDYENAIESISKAIDLGARDANIYNELGICLFTVGDADRAIDIFNKGIELEEGNYRIIFNRGMVYMRLGLLEEAADDIKRAYMLNPDDEAVKDQMQQLKMTNKDIRRNSGKEYEI
ncbi:MAG: tetratricopeptide repeat protein [Tissierellia bacterium]|nr:tetratricopeptide repeat protein [Tissierellia bacterium]